MGVVRNGGYFVYIKEVPNLQPGTNCWVEFWYKEQLQSREVSVWSNVTVATYANRDVTKATFDVASTPLQRTYGQWRKVGLRLKFPMTQDGVLRFAFVNAYGTLRIDGLKILPVTDRQADTLLSFIEASDIE